MPDRGPCLIIPHRSRRPLAPARRQAMLMLMAVRERFEGTGRAFLQLVFMIWMLVDARRRRMAWRFFTEDHVDVASLDVQL